MVLLRILLMLSAFQLVSGQDQTRTPCTWLYRADTNTENGILTSYTTLDDCQNNCLKDSCSYGLDWDSMAHSCFFSTSPKIGVAYGVFHYYLSCAGTTTSFPFNYTFSSASNLAATKLPCDWIVLNDTNTQGASPSPGDTVEDCKSLCSKTPSCYNGPGFDFNNNKPPGQRCWLSVGYQKFIAPGIDHHEVSPSCRQMNNSPGSSIKLKPDVLLTVLLMIGVIASSIYLHHISVL